MAKTKGRCAPSFFAPLTLSIKIRALGCCLSADYTTRKQSQSVADPKKQCFAYFVGR